MVRCWAAGRWLLLVVGLLLLSACQEYVLPTRMAVAELSDPSPTGELDSDEAVEVPSTWTPAALAVEETATLPPTVPAPDTATPPPTDTPVSATETPIPTRTAAPTVTLPPSPTNTTIPTETSTAAPQPSATIAPSDTPVDPPSTNTATPLPQATAAPTNTPAPPSPGANLLPNPSFEEGHYNSGGVAELQVPNGWILEWDGGNNPFVLPPDDYYVRPETRVLPAYQLPAHEQPLYVWDGLYTVKIFKGYWAIKVNFFTDLHLEPGTYRFEVNLYPDLVERYENGQKVWAPDPYSGETRFIVTGAGTDWFPPVFGQRNTFNHTFVVHQAQSIRVGISLRNRYGIMNNGWFLDNWALRRIGN